MLFRREIEQTIDEMLHEFKVVLVTGARQVGKTTVLAEHLHGSYSYVSLEDPAARNQAAEDAVLFFQINTLPLIIDEVQRLPELFQTIKFIVDRSGRKGSIVLASEQAYRHLQGLSESLAGRIGILEMSSLSLRELMHQVSEPAAYVPHYIDAQACPKGPDDLELWKIIQRGSMPVLYADDVSWDRFWSSYVQTYLERDVRSLINLKNERGFYNFMIAAAARSGQLFDATDIANDINVDYKTIQSWSSILQASGIIRIIYPFWPNTGKQLTKTPKMYFMDTGLICHLTRWTTPDQLRLGAVSGHVFETFAVSEVLKSYMNAGANLRDVWFYRDSKKHEIDLVIQEGHILHPVEIKMAATVGPSATKNFSCLDSLDGYETGFGHIICRTEKPYMVSRNIEAIPVWAI